MNKFKRDLDEFIGDSPRFNEPLKRKILVEIKKENKSSVSASKGFGAFKYVAIFTILLAFVTFFLILTLNENRQGPQTPSNAQQENPVLTDLDTVAEIETFTEYEEPLEVFDFRYDAMDRGDHEYAAYPLLINPLAYEGKDISRGDVVVYEYEFFDGVQKTVSRVVGLPGESVEIKDGQIFIDERKLETFYGKAHRVGTSSLEEYSIWFEENASSNSSTSGMEEIFQMDTEKIQLAEDEVFLVGDDWFRGSQHSLEAADIQGEVIGYYKE